MALSVLSITGFGPKSHGLWDSKTKKWFLTGTQDEMFRIKNIIEECEQQEANEKHIKDLKAKYTKQLVAAGLSRADAVTLIQQRIKPL